MNTSSTPETPVENDAPKKRNCGRTGPTSDAGRFNSSQNALKHGACSKTLILPSDSEQGWLILLSRWHHSYQPRPESLEDDFVLRTAQSEWYRIRTQRQYDDFLLTTLGRPPFTWTPEQIKMHDLMLRYVTAAERKFQREYRLLEAHYKSHKLFPPAPTPDPGPLLGPTVVHAPIEVIRKDMMGDRQSKPLPPLVPSPSPS